MCVLFRTNKEGLLLPQRWGNGSLERYRKTKKIERERERDGQVRAVRCDGRLHRSGRANLSHREWPMAASDGPAPPPPPPPPPPLNLQHSCLLAAIFNNRHTHTHTHTRTHTRKGSQTRRDTHRERERERENATGGDCCLQRATSLPPTTTLTPIVYPKAVPRHVPFPDINLSVHRGLRGHPYWSMLSSSTIHSH